MNKFFNNKILLLLLLLLLLLPLNSTVCAANTQTPLTADQFSNWPKWPEYTVFNYFPNKGRNCTWYAHGRMMQLGYCKYTLDSMRFNANTWAEKADRGAQVTDVPGSGVIAFWDSGVYFNSALGHVAVVEAVLDNGSILISESSSSASAYRTRQIAPEDSIWPSAFIVVPPAKERSDVFSSGELVEVKADRLNFRVEGVNEDPVLLDKGTIITIKEHPANGLYASQPGSITAYHHWWYACYDTEEEVLLGWVAETHLETTGATSPEPPAEKEPAALPPAEKEPAALPPDAPEAEQTSSAEEEAVPNPEIKYGDVLGNGVIDIRDVVLVIKHVLQIEELAEDQRLAADVNQDGAIDVLDASMIMRHVLGLITAF